MKTKFSPILLIITISIFLGYAFSRPLMASDNTRSVSVDEVQSEASQAPMPAAALNCASPDQASVASCQAMEQAILDSTVRLVMVSPLTHVEGSGYRLLSGNGHATVKDGRYLISHNHYDEDLFSVLLQGDPDALITIYIFDADGELITQVAGQTVSVAVLDSETVVFDFGDEGGLGLFEALGVPSASFMTQPASYLRPGMEVAQIDWDGTSTHIDWVNIERVTTVSGTAVVQLANCVRIGASGGGLFWQGSHVGNNWNRSTQCNQEMVEGLTVQTTVALNSE